MKSATVYKKSINHHGEKVCGDNFQMRKTKNSKIFILSDGLGSGIKASILSILTTEIIATMFESEVMVHEILDTITKSLPVCQKRGIAYSTFTIVEVFNDGKVLIVNYDNPDPLVIKNKSILDIHYVEELINDKLIKKAKLELHENDVIYLFSDGMLNAGLGNIMDFGWGWEKFTEYLTRVYLKNLNIKESVDSMLELTNIYYGNKPGDDATLIAIKCIENPYLNIFTGPPLDKKTDYYYVNKFMESKGKKITCGGTTSNIISKMINKEIDIDLDQELRDLPPYGKMEGIDLVTEGVLTIKKLIELLKSCKTDMYELDFIGQLNGAEKIFLYIRESDEINMLVGRKVNAFYHNPDLPFDMSIRSNLIRELKFNLERLNKKVIIEYC
ncbi:MAG: hypothetical protein PWP46_685 [Fusobacteriaceae bacterium]|jgi:hypothetical protein|nr:hypothetical protein [Fusobacteriales bacterium]MDN5303806.1 hypothetical protein [Fusobacteriaceae bacterium]